MFIELQTTQPCLIPYTHAPLQSQLLLSSIHTKFSPLQAQAQEGSRRQQEGSSGTEVSLLCLISMKSTGHGLARTSPEIAEAYLLNPIMATS